MVAYSFAATSIRTVNPACSSKIKAVLKSRIFTYLVWVPLVSIISSTAVLYASQDRLLFAGAGGRAEMPVHDELVGELPDQDGHPRAWVAEPAGAPRATVIYFHGNAALAQDMFEVRHSFLKHGLRVLFTEYPGYGVRNRATASYDTVVPDAVDLLRAARQAYPTEPLWVFGESLGAAVTAQAVADSSVPVERVMLAVPWHRFDTLVESVYPWLPVKRLVKAEYDSCAALMANRARVWVVVAENDRVIPARHGLALAACLGLPADHVRRLPGAGHNSWSFFLGQQPDGWAWLLDGHRQP